MTPKRIVRGKVNPPLYIDKVDHLPVLDGYTWKELAQGFYGDCMPLPCPRCGESNIWDIDGVGECVVDGEPYPTLERGLQGISRRGLIKLIKEFALKGK